MHKTFSALCLFSIGICLSSAGPFAFADDGSKTTGQKTLLKGSAGDSEVMKQSVKLLIPAATPPPPAQPPRRFQAGAQNSYSPRPFNLGAGQGQRNPFNLNAQGGVGPLHNFAPVDVHPFTPYQNVYHNFQTPIPPGIPKVGLWGAGGVVLPQHVYIPTPPRRVQPRAQAIGAVIDPWSNFTVEPFRQRQLASMQTAIQRLDSQPVVAQAATAKGLPVVAAAPLQATQMALPLGPAPRSWDTWYRLVAAAMYDRWKQNTAGPGKATVSITVFDTRYVDCKVTEFAPALGAERNALEESRFKQVALQCVSSLSGDEVWQFPAIAPVPGHIVFDMEFNHVVGEGSGCTVVHLHTGEAPDTINKKI